MGLGNDLDILEKKMSFNHTGIRTRIVHSVAYSLYQLRHT